MKRMRRACLLGGAALVAMMAWASPAMAQNECGAPAANGAVTCTAAGNPYANGITYRTDTAIAVTTNADVRVTRTLSVTSNTATATVASNGTVATTVAGATGIAATGVGNVTVNAAGVTTTGMNSAGIIGNSSAGTVTITSTAASVAAAGGSAILGLGVSGVSITSGTASAIDNSAIYAVSRNGPVAISITGATSSTTGAIGADAAVFAASGAAVTINVAAGATVTGNNAITASSATGSTITNAGTLNGANGYALQVNLGTATLTNSGTITGRVNFLGSNSGSSMTSSRLTNTGTFNVTNFSLFGTGAPTLVNSGTIQVLASAPTDGTLSFVGLSSTANSGLISLANGRVGDVLTLPGSFAGSGNSTVALDVRAGSTTTLADRLVIGGAATGTTLVTLTNASTSSGLVGGTTVIQAGAGTSATAFQLAAASTNAGFTNYALAFNAANNSFSLVGAPGAAAYRPLRLYEGGRNIANQTNDLWSAHLRSQRDALEGGGRLWGAVIGGRQTRDDFESTSVFGQTSVQNLSYSQDYYGAQLGFDLARVNDDGGFQLGLLGGYTHSRQNFRGSGGRAKFETVDIGAYTTFQAGPAFVNLLGKYEHYTVTYDDASAGFSGDLDGHSFDGVVEVGYRGDFGGLTIEPLASIGYTYTLFDDFSALNSGFDFQGANTFRGKAGLRLAKSLGTSESPVTIYVGGNAVKDFGSNDELLYTSNGTTLSLRGRREPFYGEGFVGLNIGGYGHLTGFIEGTGTVGGNNALTGGGGRAGLRLRL